VQRRLLTAALVLLCSSGCGGGGASAPAAASPAVVQPVVVTPAAPFPCTAETGLPLPAGWPAEVPLPDALLVTRTERRSDDRLIAYARVPGEFRSVVSFFNAQLPAAGFTQRNGQIDPFDAESDFVGAAVQGRWAVGLSPECEGATSLTVLVLPAGTPLPPVAGLPQSRPPA